uniref:protein HEATR9 n=1 Tax=Jaculus jaculus TaxID=51337 RepID=UPI001E1B20D2|nr:protein HEATR9 [Jaculus jaculus]
MSYENLNDIFDITRLTFKYPWLDYPTRSKEFRKAMAPVHLPLSCYKLPKEEFPPSPECWRQHPSKRNATPFCRANRPELCTDWRTLNDQRREREAQQILRKRRNVPRYLKEELIDSLNSPREDEQCYAAQALGCLGITDNSVREALLKVAKTGPQKVKNEVCRTLAILGCLNKCVVQTLIKQLTGQDEQQRMETLIVLRVALNSWAAIPKDQQSEVGGEEVLVRVLQMLMSSSKTTAALEAALCLGFLRPCSNTAQEFLLQCLYQGPKSQRMKALRMLVKMMHIHSTAITKAILEQLCSSDALEDRFEATQMLKTIGLEQIQEQGLEELTFDLLKRKTHNEPFLAVRQAVAETVEELKMKPVMMNMVEEELKSPDATLRQEAVISLGVLGIRNIQVFHLLLDMLDAEENQNVKKSLQETLIVWASTYPRIYKRLNNRVFFIYETAKTVKAEPTRFRKEPMDPEEELCIQDFRRAKLNPLFIAKSCKKVGQKEKLPSSPLCFFKPQKQRPPATGSWKPKCRKQLRNLLKSQNKFGFRA